MTAAALRIYAADVEKVEHADGAVILGEMRVDGDPYASFDGVRERASIEAAKLGGTHFTLLSQWTQGRSAHSPHAIYVVVRVPREGWDSLPAQLRPRPL